MEVGGGHVVDLDTNEVHYSPSEHSASYEIIQFDTQRPNIFYFSSGLQYTIDFCNFPLAILVFT